MASVTFDNHTRQLFVSKPMFGRARISEDSESLQRTKIDPDIEVADILSAVEWAKKDATSRTIVDRAIAQISSTPSGRSEKIAAMPNNAATAVVMRDKRVLFSKSSVEEVRRSFRGAAGAVTSTEGPQTIEGEKPGTPNPTTQP